MIKFENTRVVGWGSAIRGMRNPMNSWDKSDSFCCPEEDRKCGVCEEGHTGECIRGFIVGPNDLELMKKLRNAGTDHRKFMRMIVVYVDITAPLYWWKEFDTYKVGTVANSCSTMHKITTKEFTLDDFSTDKLITRDDDWDDLTCEMIDGQVILNNYAPSDILQLICNMMNFYRNLYLTEEHPDDKKIDWWQMIQLLPSSYNQKRTVMMNYEVLAGIYPMRKNHKLDEWSEHEPDLVIRQGDDIHYMYPYHGFCDWIKTLPYSELITGSESLKFEKLGQEVVKCFEDGTFTNPPVEETIEEFLTRTGTFMNRPDVMTGDIVVSSKMPLTREEKDKIKRTWEYQGFKNIVFQSKEEK